MLVLPAHHGAEIPLTLADRHIPPNPKYIVEGGWSVDGGYHALTHLMGLDEPPTAVFAASYPMAVAWSSDFRREERWLSAVDSC